MSKFKIQDTVVMTLENDEGSVHNDLKNNIWVIDCVYQNYIFKGRVAYLIKSIQNPEFNGYISMETDLRQASPHEVYIGRAVRSFDKAKMYENVIDELLKYIDDGKDVEEMKELLLSCKEKTKPC